MLLCFTQQKFRCYLFYCRQEHKEFSERLQATEHQWKNGIENAKKEAAASLKQYEDKIRQYEQTVESLENEVKELSTSLAEKNSTIDDLRERKSALDQRMQQLQSNNNSELEQYKIERKQEVEQLKKDRNNEISRLKDTIDEYKTQIETLKGEQENLEDKVRCMVCLR